MKTKFLRCALLAASMAALSAPAFAGDLKLSMQGGRVTILANDVSLRQILQEWARVGQTTIVNIEKVSSPNLTIQLVNIPERDALDILLRSASGYIAAPRPVVNANAAVFDRITIMATSRPPSVAAGAVPPPTFQRPPTPIDDDEPINVAMPQAPPQSPATMQYPGIGPNGLPVNPNQPMGPVTSPTPGPLTAPRPGALPQPNLPPGVPNPYQTPIVRPGPGGPGGPGSSF